VEPYHLEVGSSSEERRAKIVELTENHGFCTTAELARIMGVSDMTIRRDIRKLETAGVLRSVHGGAAKPRSGTLEGTALAERAQHMVEAKRAIAEAAAQCLPADGAVALDTGTTTLLLVDYLPRDRGTQVITSSLPVINALSEIGDVELTCLGGTFHARSLSFAGPATVAAIAELRIHTLFLSAMSVDASGVYCGTEHDAITKRELVRVSDEVILLADSTKFTASAMMRVCPLRALSKVITDEGLSSERRSLLEKAGVEVIVCRTA
jgi:DeoR/GlpR family transcriptional regulator of sugar metabolism